MKNLLRQYVSMILSEVLEGPHISNVLSKSLSSREQIGSLAQRKDDEEISPHLIEPEISEEECFGPVPPVAEEPGVYADSFNVDYHVLPTSHIKRG